MFTFLSLKNIHTVTMPLKWQRKALQWFTKVLKTLHPGEIRTHDLLFLWLRRWPLHAAARAPCELSSKGQHCNSSSTQNLAPWRDTKPRSSASLAETMTTTRRRQGTKLTFGESVKCVRAGGPVADFFFWVALKRFDSGLKRFLARDSARSNQLQSLSEDGFNSVSNSGDQCCKTVLAVAATDDSTHEVHVRRFKLYLFFFVARAFILYYQSHEQCILSQVPQQHCYVSQKTLTPWRDSNQGLLFFRLVRWPLRHAAS
jgi:hypothetical protein